MDEAALDRYFSDMETAIHLQNPIPSWQLYGEQQAFPDVLHCERITDRAAGLDWVIAPHRHPRLHQFFLIRAGEVEMSVDGARLHLAPPTMISMPRATVHGFAFSAGTDGLVVTLPLETLPDLFDPRGPSGALLDVAVIEGDQRMGDLFEALHEEHENRAPERAIALRALVSLLAVEISRRLPGRDSVKGTRTNPRFRAFEELVQTHFREGWHLADYARALSVSTRHLGRLCHLATGQPPNAYLDAVTMREACRLIVYTSDTIAAIAYQLGFEDPSYFARAFRRHMGLTPRQYRAGFENE